MFIIPSQQTISLLLGSEPVDIEYGAGVPTNTSRITRHGALANVKTNLTSRYTEL